MTEKQLQQRREALTRANTVRTKRAALKRALADGEVTLPELLEAPPAVILGAEIGDVLSWAPGIGRWRCQRILAPGPGSPGVGRAVLVAHLSDASKARLIARYEEMVPFRYAQQAVAA